MKEFAIFYVLRSRRRRRAAREMSCCGVATGVWANPWRAEGCVVV